ncbi:MAG: radical SAM/SPASM domain-containing protein [Clostridia bacterium]|nr:radical SAM/SPASM domain-containing protein [Clostridia bacterium]
MPNKAFLEITNACNLACSFCHGTKRPIRYISREEFTRAATELRTFADYLYFHLMGEPLLHPDLPEFFEIAGQLGFKVIITTNGTLLPKKTELLLSAPSLFKVSVSLHSYEANSLKITPEEYLDGCFDFCDRASAQGIVSVMRLWNIGGEDSLNTQILDRMHARFPGEWRTIFSGYKLRHKLFLEWGEKFEWPDPEAEFYGDTHTCHGLRDQVGVLSDGTVVPCCLDADGVIALGNLFETPLSGILSSKRASRMRKAFEKRIVTEPLCQRCGFAHMKNF